LYCNHDNYDAIVTALRMLSPYGYTIVETFSEVEILLGFAPWSTRCLHRRHATSRCCDDSMPSSTSDAIAREFPAFLLPLLLLLLTPFCFFFPGHYGKSESLPTCARAALQGARRINGGESSGASGYDLIARTLANAAAGGNAIVIVFRIFHGTRRFLSPSPTPTLPPRPPGAGVAVYQTGL